MVDDQPKIEFVFRLTRLTRSIRAVRGTCDSLCTVNPVFSTNPAGSTMQSLSSDSPVLHEASAPCAERAIHCAQRLPSFLPTPRAGQYRVCLPTHPSYTKHPRGARNMRFTANSQPRLSINPASGANGVCLSTHSTVFKHQRRARNEPLIVPGSSELQNHPRDPANQTTCACCSGPEGCRSPRMQ